MTRIVTAASFTRKFNRRRRRRPPLCRRFYFLRLLHLLRRANDTTASRLSCWPRAETPLAADWRRQLKDLALSNSPKVCATPEEFSSNGFYRNGNEFRGGFDGKGQGRCSLVARRTWFHLEISPLLFWFFRLSTKWEEDSFSPSFSVDFHIEVNVVGRMGGRPTQKIPFSADVSLSRFYSISICVVYLVGVRPKERERVVARRQKGTERNQKKRLRAFRMSIMISLSDGKGERERGALGDFCLISVSPLFFSFFFFFRRPFIFFLSSQSPHRRVAYTKTHSILALYLWIYSTHAPYFITDGRQDSPIYNISQPALEEKGALFFFIVRPFHTRRGNFLQSRNPSIDYKTWLIRPILNIIRGI